VGPKPVIVDDKVRLGLGLELSPGEIRVIEARADGRTLRSIASELGKSRERVRQMEARARGRLAAYTRRHIDSEASGWVVPDLLATVRMIWQ
jgi:DNA-directed RNA polymerase sigma subunit (sigma70/sigma32)